MKPPLYDQQRLMAAHRITFNNLLSPEVAEGLRRASLACSENHRTQTGIVDLFCGLYLQDPNELAVHFRGDINAVVKKNFPIARTGREGLFPQGMLEGTVSESDPGVTGFAYTFQFSDELVRLLWTGTRLANAVGKKTSIKDLIAAITLDPGWMEELLRNGMELSHKIVDFEMDIGTVIFHATIHSIEGWPRHAEFSHDGTFLSPFTLEVSTPAGPFQAVKAAKIMLNGDQVAEIFSPARPSASVAVELLKVNKVEFEFDGPSFGSIEITVRGIPA